jgi:hypothetical protein
MNIGGGQASRDSLSTRLFIFRLAFGRAYLNLMRVRIQSVYVHGAPENGCNSTYIDSINVAYGTSTQTIPQVSAARGPVSSTLNAVRNRITTVSGRSACGQSQAPGTYIDGNRKTVRVEKDRAQ